MIFLCETFPCQSVTLPVLSPISQLPRSVKWTGIYIDVRNFRKVLDTLCEGNLQMCWNQHKILVEETSGSFSMGRDLVCCKQGVSYFVFLGRDTTIQGGPEKNGTAYLWYLPTYTPHMARWGIFLEEKWAKIRLSGSHSMPIFSNVVRVVMKSRNGRI